MMRALFVLLIPFYFLADAQIKEINFLGKSWYLHGVDVRLTLPIKNPKTTTSFITNTDRQFDAPENRYGYSSLRRFSLEDIRTWSDFGISTGLLFKPFAKSDIRFLSSSEFIHNLSFRKEKYFYSWETIKPIDYDPGGDDARRTASMFIYNPSLNFSTRAIAKRIKLYAGMDARFATSNNISMSINSYAVDSFFTNTNIPENEDLILNTSMRSIGAGYTMGIKIAPTCYFNFHCELKNTYSSSWYSNTKDNFGQRLTQVHFGFRYKFAGPIADEEAIERIQNTQFW